MGLIIQLRLRFHELTQVWVIAHSLLLNDVSETTYVYLSIYVILNLLTWSAVS